jgi:hypothetical protein
LLLPIKNIFILALLLGCSAFAKESSTLNSSVRALGMGDAFTAVASDDSSLFYNPAGLARVSGLNLKVFDLGAGASGAAAYKKITGLQGAGGAGFANQVTSLYGEHVWTGVGAETIFTMPMFGIGVYDHAGATIRVNNPVYPQLHTRFVNDYGYIAGMGIPLSPFIHVGASLKYLKRTGADTTYGPSFIADLDPNTIINNLRGWGAGYGADLGATIILPAPFFTASLSAAWKNMGEIQFRSLNNTDIPKEPNNVTLGAAFSFDTPIVSVTPAFDFTNLTNTDLQMTRKINFGVELGLPLLDIRAGFHEGYYTGGLGVNLGLFRVDLATYGVELGDYPGQIEDRRYIAQFTMELGVGNFTATSGGKSVAGSKGGAGAAEGATSSTSSIWGGRRLKQRR